MIIDAAGNLFGSTSGGSGATTGGGVWMLAAGSSTLTTLAGFSTSGTGPTLSYGGLVADAQGNLYGTSGNGGTYGLGTVFKLTNTDYMTTAPAAAAAVPAPATSGMMLAGVGLAGSAMRRRPVRIGFA